MPEMCLCLAHWALAVVATAAASDLITTATILRPLRERLALGAVRGFRISKFFNALFSCYYCLTVWFASAIAWSLPGEATGIPWLDVTIRTLTLHWLAFRLDR